MTIRLGINGFGRIGRTVYRALRTRSTAGGPGGAAVELVAVNDAFAAGDFAHLLELDSVAGPLGVPVSATEGGLDIGGELLPMISHSDPAEIPWRDFGVDVVIESSRLFTDADRAAAHLDAGAKLVVVSAPSKGADATFVVGVNDATFDPGAHRVVSNASCTTNCLAPMLKVLDDAFGVDHALMTTVHAYTSDQALVDGPGRDKRAGRAAALNAIPMATGAARAIGLVLPSAAGRVDGHAVRVPVPDGSLTDLTVTLGSPGTVDAVNAAFRAAAGAGSLAGIVEYSDKPIVSSDIVGRAASCVFDAPLTLVSGPMVKVFGWYDNEWAYANRLVDLVGRLGRAAGFG